MYIPYLIRVPLFCTPVPVLPHIHLAQMQILHTTDAVALAYRPDGAQIVVSTLDAQLSFWDVLTTRIAGVCSVCSVCVCVVCVVCVYFHY
jgi:hypothetical protein